MDAVYRYSIPHAIKLTRVPGKGYDWICIRDPEGYYRTNLFRIIDIEFDQWETCCWADGTVFLNLYTPEIKIVKGQRLITDFIMPIRCNTYWAFYQTFSEISKAIHEKQVGPKYNKAYLAALDDLREHMKNCPECKQGINVAFTSSREHPADKV